MKTEKHTVFILLYGFMMIMSIHMGMKILEALISHVAIILFEYGELPLLRFLFLPVEIFLMVRFLTRFPTNIAERLKGVLKLAVSFVLLFVLFRFNQDLTVKFEFGFFCFPLREGEIEEATTYALSEYKSNLNFVSTIETITYSVALLYYVIRKAKMITRDEG